MLVAVGCRMNSKLAKTAGAQGLSLKGIHGGPSQSVALASSEHTQQTFLPGVIEANRS